MGEVMRIEGGDLIDSEAAIRSPIRTPLGHQDKWLSAADLRELSGIGVTASKKALNSRRWRGSDLLVKEETGNRSYGGKCLYVHVDSLPSDLRQAWYLERGIDLHAQCDPATGEMVLVPQEALDRNKQHEGWLVEARWRHDVIRPILAIDKSRRGGRAQKIDELAAMPRLWPCGKTQVVPRRTLYHWVQCFEKNNAGLRGLMRTPKADKGRKKMTVSLTWDAFFAPHIDGDVAAQVNGELTHYIRSLWGSGERGKYAVSEKATTRLIELSRDLGVVAFEALELGRPVSRANMDTQFGVCFVNTRRVSEERAYQKLAVKRKDNARYQDQMMPHILRDYSQYKPREIVVGDVHPVDVMMKRPDGSVVYPKAIAWLDVATNEIHMTFVLLEKGEGVRREHIAQSFEAMVGEWGLPSLLYLDNGSEYCGAEMIGGFTMLSKLSQGAFSLHDLCDSAEVSERVMGSREAVVRSLAYNAKGKPKIEGAFGNIEQVFFAAIQGWTAGDRMSKKTHAKGKDPIAFDGTASDFLAAASTMLEWYHKRPQRGRLDGLSPNEALRGHIDTGWGKTMLSDPNVLPLAFSDEVTRTPRSGRVSYKDRHNRTSYFYADELLNITYPITLRVPFYKADLVFCFDGERFICTARPERTFGVLDRAGAQELGRRKKVFAREVRELAQHCALLDLVDETARHNRHLADTPDAPVGATVDVDHGALGRMLAADKEAQAELAKAPSRPAPSQWKPFENKARQNLVYAED